MLVSGNLPPGMTAGSMYEDTKPPYHFNAPDVWNVGIMIIQVIFQSLEHELVTQLTDEKRLFGCGEMLVAPFDRDLVVEQQSQNDYRVRYLWGQGGVVWSYAGGEGGVICSMHYS